MFRTCPIVRPSLRGAIATNQSSSCFEVPGLLRFARNDVERCGLRYMFLNQGVVQIRPTRIHDVLDMPSVRPSLRGAIATKQSSSCFEVLDCFVSLAMTWKDAGCG